MIYIILSIVLSVFLLVLFKLFDKYKVNTLHAIIFNYFTATITGIVFIGKDFNIGNALDSNWIFVCLPLGVLLISVFRFISLTTQKISVSTAAIANKMSVIMPVLFSIVALRESINTIKITGILLALAALYLSTKKQGSGTTQEKKFIYLPLLVFIGSGLIDVIINAANAFLIKDALNGAMFTTCSFGVAGIAGLIILVIQLLKHSASKEENRFLEIKSVMGGIALGIPNYFSIFFILKSLDSGIFSGAQLFPILNISNVLLAAIIGSLAFREKLSAINYAGIVIAVASIILIAL